MHYLWQQNVILGDASRKPDFARKFKTLQSDY